MDGADVDRSADRLRHRDIEAADQAANAFSDDQPESIGPEHRDDWRRVEAANNERFEGKAERAHQDRRCYHSRPDWQAMAIGEICDVAAEQDELALREIEDPHHAGDDPEAQHDQDY